MAKDARKFSRNCEYLNDNIFVLLEMFQTHYVVSLDGSTDLTPLPEFTPQNYWAEMSYTKQVGYGEASAMCQRVEYVYDVYLYDHLCVPFEVGGSPSTAMRYLRPKAAPTRSP